MSAIALFGAFENHEICWNQNPEDPWWVGRDICAALKIANHRDALAGLDDDERDDVGIADAIGRIQSTIIVNEPGLYRLIFKSRTKKAKQFQRWVFHEILPAVRKTGSYVTPSSPLPLPLPLEVDPFRLPSVLLSDRSKLPSVAGLYFVICRSALLYIGCSTNIRRRWSSHGRVFQLRQWEEVRIAWSEYLCRDIVEVEGALVEYFQPMLNYQGVDENLLPSADFSTPQRGGRREGAGRKSQWNSPTKMIRLPEKFEAEILEYAKELDEVDRQDGRSRTDELT